MLPRFICAGAFVLLIGGAAAAQPNTSTSQSDSKPSIPIFQQAAPPTQEQIERQKALDRDYEATIHKLPNKKNVGRPVGRHSPYEKQAAIARKQKGRPKPTFLAGGVGSAGIMKSPSRGGRGQTAGMLRRSQTCVLAARAMKKNPS
jgi:hypothetical protein